MAFLSFSHAVWYGIFFIRCPFGTSLEPQSLHWWMNISRVALWTFAPMGQCRFCLFGVCIFWINCRSINGLPIFFTRSLVWCIFPHVICLLALCMPLFQKNLWGGAQPPPQVQRDTPLPHNYPSWPPTTRPHAVFSQLALWQSLKRIEINNVSHTRLCINCCLYASQMSTV